MMELGGIYDEYFLNVMLLANDFLPSYEERTFEAYMERKIGGFLQLYSGRGFKLVSSLCTEMSS